MKRLISRIFAAVSIVLAAVGCDKEENSVSGDGKIWDIAPVNLILRASEGGHDLFDLSYEGNIIDGVSVTYEGKDYKVEPDTKAWLAVFKGLQHYDFSEMHILVFGEFSGTKDYKDMTFVVNWPDGKKDVVVYNRTFKWGRNGDPVIKEQASVNGKEGKMIIERNSFGSY